MEKPEILAPCGSYEVLTAALRAGCDAVYLGGSDFSARQSAANFSDEEIGRAVFDCHKRGVKLYRTVNTVVFDEQTEELLRAVRHSAETGVDGLITQDLALVQMVKSCCPELPIHASTQMTVHSRQGVLLCKEMGFSRAVLSRELSLGIIKELSRLGIETEVFVHGALCMSVSGQCYMSAVIGSRSANRGRCAQACRLPCSAVGDKESCDLSLKDMSYYEHMKELAEAGVSSLKIEGRMKRPEYAAMAVDCCKRALTGQGYDRETLAGVFSRGGFTDGYLTGRRGRDMFGVRSREDVLAANEALPKIHELYRSEEKRSEVTLSLKVRAGEPVTLTARDKEGTEVTASGSCPERAQNRALDRELADRQLAKLGGSIYALGGTEHDIADGLFVSPAELNRLRREVCDKLDRARAEKNTRRAEFKNALPETEDIPQSGTRLRASVTTAEQLGALDMEAFELVAVPLALADKAMESVPADKLCIAPPRFTFDEKGIEERLRAARERGTEHLLAMNLAHIRMGRELGFTVHGSYGLNLTNSLALKQAKELGLWDTELSFELKAAQIRALKKPLPAGIFAYGRLPLMLTVNCPVRKSVGCRGCTGGVTDRTGRRFPVLCSREEGYVEILNSDELFLADRLGEMGSLSFLWLHFTDEGAQEARRVTKAYQNREKAPGGGFTRGLYFRGVE